MRGKGKIEIPEIKTRKNIPPASEYLSRSYPLYTLYIGQLLWGIIIDILILRLYFLMTRERSSFRKYAQNEDEPELRTTPK